MLRFKRFETARAGTPDELFVPLVTPYARLILPASTPLGILVPRLCLGTHCL